MTATGAAIGVSTMASAELVSPQTVVLDSHRTPNVGVAGPAATTDVLTSGRYYVATVQGTFSAFRKALWQPGFGPRWEVCGTPEALPMTPSPGRPDAPAGQDSEMFFARPWQKPCAYPLPKAYGGFQVDVGDGYGHPVASGGPYTAPRADHTYDYLLQGRGHVVRFRQLDSQTTDNTGVYTITVRPATQPDCGGNPSCLATSLPATSGTATSTSTNAASSLGLPSNRQCLSRRRFQIRIVTTPSRPVVRATVLVSGKPVSVRRVRLNGRTRLVAIVDLRRFRRDSVTVKITARLRNGRTLHGSRVYRTCTGKLRGGKPEL